jgi:hypothetical protein
LRLLPAGVALLPAGVALLPARVALLPARVGGRLLLSGVGRLLLSWVGRLLLSWVGARLLPRVGRGLLPGEWRSLARVPTPAANLALRTGAVATESVGHPRDRQAHRDHDCRHYYRQDHCDPGDDTQQTHHATRPTA